jgi:hypothetical protein
MASLTIRNVPEDILGPLRQAAEEERRSINSQALYWLEDTAQRWQSRTEFGQLFDRIRARREEIYRRHGVGSDSAKIIRRMRDERTAQLAGERKGRRAKIGTRSRT